MIHYYFGSGKGKTTAALGLMARALGTGRKAVLVQFLKEKPSGEVTFFGNMESVTILRGRENHDGNLRQAINLVRNGQCNLLVLDEVADAVKKNLIDGTLLLDFLRGKPDGLEVVMTGHEPLPVLLELADYVTEMKKHKHPYDRGIKAREGIEF
jgi:cob(I)alamin adenosyltransferase